MIPVALVLLLMGTTLGVVWHHHATSSPDNCPICHLSHQAVEPAPANARVAVLVATGDAPEAQHLRFVRVLSARQLPPRAPPA